MQTSMIRWPCWLRRTVDSVGGWNGIMIHSALFFRSEFLGAVTTATGLPPATGDANNPRAAGGPVGPATTVVGTFEFAFILLSLPARTSVEAVS